MLVPGVMVATRWSVTGKGEAEGDREGEMVRLVGLFLHCTNIYLASIMHKTLCFLLVATEQE